MKNHTKKKNTHTCIPNKSPKTCGGKRKHTRTRKNKKRGENCGCEKKLDFFGGNPNLNAVPLNLYSMDLLPKSSTLVGGKQKKQRQNGNKRQKKGGGFSNLFDGLNPISISTISNSALGIPQILTGYPIINVNPNINQPISSQRSFLV